MKTRGMIVLICLFVCAGMAFAGGGGGAFTIGADAGYSANGTYTSPHPITYDYSTTRCIGSSIIPKWYIQEAGLAFTPTPPSSCVIGPNSADSEDFDFDGCQNIVEYYNYLCLNQSKECNDNMMSCAYQPGSICSASNPTKPSACNTELIATCTSQGGACRGFGAPTWCDNYCRHLNQQDIDAIPEFNGTAIILLAIVVLAIALLQGHFHKK